MFLQKSVTPQRIRWEAWKSGIEAAEKQQGVSTPPTGVREVPFRNLPQRLMMASKVPETFSF
jgi:hypothetical protein